MEESDGCHCQTCASGARPKGRRAHAAVSALIGAAKFSSEQENLGPSWIELVLGGRVVKAEAVEKATLLFRQKLMVQRQD